MAGETPITVVGNLTADPELRWTQSGKAVANLTIASTPRSFDRQSGEWRDGEALFMRCTVWENSGAQNVAESLRRGDRVIAFGNLEQRSFETREGEKRTTVQMTVEEIGPSVKWAQAVPQKQNGQQRGGGQQRRDDRQDDRRGGGRQQQRGQYDGPPPGYDDPWGSAPPAGSGDPYDSEPPF